MKLKLIADYDDKRKKGYEMEIDKIKRDLTVSGFYLVRVISEWKKPAWFAIGWFQINTVREDE